MIRVTVGVVSTGTLLEVPPHAKIIAIIVRTDRIMTALFWGWLAFGVWFDFAHIVPPPSGGLADVREVLSAAFYDLLYGSWILPIISTTRKVIIKTL